MRFEIFEGSRSRGSIELQDEGVIRFEIEDPRLRLLLMLFFASDLPALMLEGEASAGPSIVRPDWSPWGFERACQGLERVGTMRAVARPANVVPLRQQERDEDSEPQA